MIRRFPQRPPRRPHQDFHFFAASDPIANVESQFAHRAAAPAEQPQSPGAMEAQEPSALPVEPIAAPIAPSENPAVPPPAPAAAAPLASGPPYRINIPIRPESAAALGRALRVRPSDEQTEEGESSETEDSDDESSLERAIRSAAKIRAGQSLFQPERPAIEELQALERKRKRRPPASNKSKASLATPRQNRPSPMRESQSAQGLSGHELRCTICPHPYRAEIENEFLHWHTIRHIAYDYEVSRSAIYRHAHALGLFSRRNRNLRFALGHLIERVQDVEPTADSIVRAIHAFARINDEGDWIEPPAHVIVSSGGIHREAAAGPSRRPIAIPLDSQTLSNVIDVTPEPVLPAAAPGTVNRVNADATP
ncbi:MAG: hypothetical protein WBQ34_15720 [Candidatus Acidiferrales bacterium]